MAAYGGSEEYLAGLGRGTRPADQGDYLNQVNRGTDTTVGLIQHAGDQMAQNTKDYWKNLQQGVESGINNYERVQDRNLAKTKYQSEEARANAEADRQAKMFDLTKQKADQDFALENKIVGPNGESVAELKSTMPLKELDFKQKQLALDSAAQQSRLETESMQRKAMGDASKMAALQLNKTSTDLATEKAENALHNAVASGNNAQAQQVMNQLRSEGVPEQAIQTALNKKNAEVAAARTNGDLQVLLRPDYQDAKKGADQLKDDTTKLVQLEGLKDAFVNGKNQGKWFGLVKNGMNDESAKDAANQFADFLVQSGNPQQADRVRNGFVDSETIDSMNQYIKIKEESLKKNMLANEGNFAKYGNRPEIAYPVGLARSYNTPEFKKSLRQTQGIGANGNKLAPLTQSGSMPQSSSMLNQAFMAGGLNPQQAQPQPVNYTPPGAPQQQMPSQNGPIGPNFAMPPQQQQMPGQQGIIPASAAPVPSLRNLSRGNK